MSGIRAQGAAIRVLDTTASPMVYVDIGCITDLTGPDGSRAEIDTTCLSSTAREFNVGIPNNGSVSANGILDTTANAYHVGSALSLWSSFKSGAEQTFRLIIPNSPEDFVQFNAYVMTFQYQANGPDEVFRFSTSLKIDGEITDSF